ncbi:MAG TPA: diguanylate cyclase [Stenotrophomonas sp.]|nr:diguanylate cyclase [Stenotrophomonas sp.]
MSDSRDPSSRRGVLRRWWPRGAAAADTGNALGGTLLPASVAAARLPGATEAPPFDPAAATAALQRLFAPASQPPALLWAFAEGMSTLHGELADMGARLRNAHAASDWEAYGRALRQLIDKYIRTIDLEPAGGGRSEAEQWRDLLRHTLGHGLATALLRERQLTEQSQTLAQSLRGWHPGQPVQDFELRVRELCHQIGLRAEDSHEQQNLLLGLFDLLLENVGELLDDRSWLQGQIGTIRQLIAGPLDKTTLEQARGSLREVMYKQGLLKQGIAESKEAMRGMMVSFVDRLDGMAASTGQYHDRVAGYSQAIANARSISGLGRLLQDILADTASVQAQALRARDELVEAQRQVDDAEQRIQALEQELRDMSDLVREDPLTGALNRRGFEELFAREQSRTLRGGQPLCVALLDLDDFRLVNQTYGHAGGDAALRHLVTTARTVLRGSDAIARFGGEEFVLLLPDATAFEARAAVVRLQRALAQRGVLHEQQRVFVSFSAGVAVCQAGEGVDGVVRRADRAMYAAKQAGKNRVVDAE